nr:MAG TPA: hypothetical protein [Caudoviricetes sp.]
MCKSRVHVHLLKQSWALLGILYLFNPYAVR